MLYALPFSLLPPFLPSSPPSLLSVPLSPLSFSLTVFPRLLSNSLPQAQASSLLSRWDQGSHLGPALTWLLSSVKQTSPLVQGGMGSD